jgi:hypothetical protein
MRNEPFRSHGSTPRPALLALAIALAGLAAACAPGNSNEQATRTSVPAPTPTATVPPLTDVTPGPATLAACAGQAGSRLSIVSTQVGPYDSWQELPSDLPLRPEPISVAKVVGNLALSTITVNIALTTPPASAPGYICAVTVRLVAFAPLPAPLPNVTRNCSDHAYFDPGGPDYGGDCGVVAGPPATASVAITGTMPGTTVTEPIANAEAPNRPAAFPSPDGRASAVWLTLKVPTSGQYAFIIGLWQDASGPRLEAEAADTFDLSPAHEWTGQACAEPAMQAQLPPPTNPPTLVLCPGPPPPYQ